MSTVAAIATPPGAGGIGIVRISGPQAKYLLARMFLPLSPHFENFRPWTLHRGRVLDNSGEPLDDVLAVFMPGPRTFTGEDTAEIHCHGGPLIVQSVLESALRLGARAAGRGEFSRRAFMNGRMDLSQAEAVAEMIAAPSRESLRHSLNRLDGLLGRRVLALREQLEQLRAQLCLAVDFPDEETECLPPEDFARVTLDTAAAVRKLLAGQKRARLMQQGAVVVLAGAVNAGKSSLLNAFLGRNRALVTDIPGTTRDFLEEQCALDGLPIRLVDTAGLRELPASAAAPVACGTPATAGGGSDALVEALGMARSRELLASADAVLLLLDGARLGAAGASAEDCPDPAAREVLAAVGATPLIVVWNKADICTPARLPLAWAQDVPCVQVSARSGENVDALAVRLRRLLLDDGAERLPDDGLAPNARQALALEGALAELEALAADAASGLSYDCCAVRLDTAAALLGEVTGRSSPAEILNKVFAAFCIGK